MSDASELLLIHGEERHLVDRDARAWLAAARAGSVTDLDVEVVDAPARLEGVRGSLTEVPFLAERRWVLVRDAPQLAARDRRGADGPEVLVAALSGRAPTTSVCLVAHHRVAPANPVLTHLRQHGRVVEHPRLKGRDLYAATQRAAEARGLRLPREAVEHVLRVTGGDLGSVDAELAKLAALADGGRLTMGDVRRLAAGTEQLAAWALLERLIGPTPGRGSGALESLLADGASTQQLTAVIAGQLRELLLAHDVIAGGRPPSALAAELGVQPWQAERLARWAGATTPALVEGWLRALQRLDAATKMGLVDGTAGLRSMTLRAARDLAPPRGRPAP